MSLEGRLEDLALADIFQIISLSKRSGVLTIVRKEGTGRLVFSKGHLVYGSSDNKSRLGFNLIKQGMITTEELEKALRIQKNRTDRTPLGTVLVKLGAITQEILEQEIKEHLVEVVRDILSWESGSFHFELGGIVQDEIIFATGVPTDFLLLESARREDEAQREKSPPPKRSQPDESTCPPTPQAGRQDKTPIPSAHAASKPAINPTSERKESPPQGDKILSDNNFGVSPNSGKDMILLNAMIEELSGPSSSSEITLLVLRYASELMARAVIFLVRKEDIIGLGQFGVDISSPDERIRGVKIPLAEPSVFRDAVNKRIPYKGPLEEIQWHRYFLDQIGGGTPLEAFVVPLISDGRVIALFYGDNLPTQQKIGATQGLETFIKITGFAFGKAMLERKLSEKGF